MYQISIESVSKFNPCKNRFDNFKSNYSNFNGSFDNFLDLTNITYDDKIWVAKKVLTKNQLVHFGILCAESVLYIYENKYPNRKKVRDCLEYLKSIQDFTSITAEQKENILKHRKAADAAAANAADAAANADAADAAAYAADAAANAAYAAYAAADANAAYAAADANAAYAAYVAAYAAAAAVADVAAAANAAYAAYVAADAYAAARKNQRNLNLTFLKMAATI